MSKYEAVYFVGDNQAINRIRVDSYKTRNRGAFSGSLAALIPIIIFCFVISVKWSRFRRNAIIVSNYKINVTMMAFLNY